MSTSGGLASTDFGRTWSADKLRPYLPPVVLAHVPTAKLELDRPLYVRAVFCRNATINPVVEALS